jgi:RNA-directed DNA polymerase
MQFDRLSKKLDGILYASKKGRKVQDLFKLMTNCKEIWFEAYANIYANSGAITKGVNNNTLDGFSEKRVDKIIQKLKNKKHRFTPARRTYIAKRDGKSKRPLGIPTGDDKLVQEVCRIILERIYEPIFKDNSHGFRPRRSCHTALKQIRSNWKSMKWIIEFDIKSFFDSMNHEVMIELLSKKIDDKRFIKLIKSMLKAGYLEDWRYYSTFSGAPQGGVISPILSNIYLHELDAYMEEMTKEFSKGRKRRRNPAYRRIEDTKYRLKKKMNQLEKKQELIKEMKSLDKEQKLIPSYDMYDREYRRLRYCRYADDFIVGIIGTKREAEEIKDKVGQFLQSKLKLKLAEEKTGIKAGNDGVRFLSRRLQSNRYRQSVEHTVQNVSQSP